ncbi:hypothetical protein FACS1894137_08880 [Spirochaetia bacterium]|nr:hypothetical protein FACS1894137_08880 [Spirochaetia bacterium]
MEDSRRALLKGILSERKIPFEERPLFAEYGGFGSSIHVVLPGPASTGTFILAVPLSFSEDDRRPLPYAFEAALAFIDTARENAPSEGGTDMLVAFLADEWSDFPKGNRKDPHLGLEDLYSRLEVPETSALLYLDRYDPRGELLIHHGARKALAPLNILKTLGQLCDTRGIPYALAVGSNELYKLSLADGPSPLEFALSRGLPALYLSGPAAAGDSAGAAPEGAPDAAPASLLLEYAASLDIGAENPDYHYLIFQFAGRTVFVQEYTTVLFFLILSSLGLLAALVYSVVFRFRLIIQWRGFLKRSWILLLQYALLILSLRVGGIALQVMTGSAGLGELWNGSAGLLYGTAAAQILFGLALFTLLSPAMDLIYVPWQANFYGNASIILGALTLPLAAAFDISFIPIFIWAFVFIFLAASVRKPPLVWLCCFLTLFLGLSSLRTLIHTGNRKLAFLILSNYTPVVLYIALIALPLFFILKRGTLLAKAYAANTSGRRMRRLNKRKVAELLIPRFLFFASAAVILWVSGYYYTRNPIRRPELQTIDDTETGKGYISMTIRDRILLGRRTVDISLEAPETPLRFKLYLEGAEEAPNERPRIYSAPMPFRYIEDPFSPNRDSIEFILGEGPPNPFTTEIVLPVDFTGFLRAEALYIAGEDYQLVIRRRYPIGSPLP